MPKGFPYYYPSGRKVSKKIREKYKKSLKEVKKKRGKK